MEIIPIKTKRLWKDPLKEVLKVVKRKLKNKDILVITSKIVSLEYNGLVKLSDVIFGKKAKKLAKKHAISPQLAELIIQESDIVLGGVKRAVLTLKNNILMANAGIDTSNVPKNQVIKLPKNIEQITDFIRLSLCQPASIPRQSALLGVVINDSVCLPLRKGTHHYALAISGFYGIIDERKEKDLFKKPMKITTHNIADEIASTAGLLMGERNNKIPAVIIRGLPVKFSNLSAKKLTKQLIISRQQDLFKNVIKI